MHTGVLIQQRTLQTQKRQRVGDTLPLPFHHEEVMEIDLFVVVLQVLYYRTLTKFYCVLC